MEELLVCREEELPPSLLARIIELLRAEWPGAFSGEKVDRTELNDPALHPLAVTLLVEGWPVAYCGVVWKHLALAGRSFKTCSLNGMVTDRTRRGSGYGQKVLAAARALMEANEADLALFTCEPALQGFYERGGFEALAGTPLVGGTRAEPFPSDSLGLVTMAAFFSPAARACRARMTGAPIFLDLAPGDLW